MFFETLLHKFYAASISIAGDGSMFVSSTRDRMMAWGLVFCIVAGLSLLNFLLWKKKHSRTLSLSLLVLSLIIPVFIMPSVKREYIHVSEQHLTVETGEWYTASSRTLDIRELQTIKESIGGNIPGNLMGDPDVNWHITWQDGKQETLDLNSFFNAHRMVLAHYIRDRGYTVELLEHNYKDL